MATLTNQRTGDAVNVDLLRHSQIIPATLPTEYVQQGLPATDQRDEGPVEMEWEITIAAVPGVSDPRETVLAFLDEAAANADRLTLTEEGMPTRTDMMVGPRALESARVSSTLVVPISYRQVRVIRATTADIILPEPAAGFGSNGADPALGGEQSSGGAILYQAKRTLTGVAP